MRFDVEAVILISEVSQSNVLANLSVCAKLNRILGLHAAPALEVGDLGAVRQAELGVEPPHFGILVRHPVITANIILMAALDHEWTRYHEVGHLRVVKGVAEIPTRHLPFDRPHKTERLVGRSYLAGPLVDIARADRQTVFL